MYRRTNSAGHDYWRQAASLCRAGGGGVSPLCCGWDPAVKRIDWSPGNRGRGAVVSCVLCTGHQWKIDEWICLFYLSWIKPCYIFVTELRMKSLSSSVVLKTRRILIKKKKKSNPNQTNEVNWGRLTTGPCHKIERMLQDYKLPQEPCCCIIYRVETSFVPVPGPGTDSESARPKAWNWKPCSPCSAFVACWDDYCQCVQEWMH